MDKQTKFHTRFRVLREAGFTPKDAMTFAVSKTIAVDALSEFMDRLNLWDSTHEGLLASLGNPQKSVVKQQDPPTTTPPPKFCTLEEARNAVLPPLDIPNYYDPDDRDVDYVNVDGDLVRFDFWGTPYSEN